MILEERIETLERQIAHAKRRNRYTLAVAGLAIVSWLGSGLWITAVPTAQAQLALGSGAVQREVRANAFILEDADGKTRAMLIVGKNGPTLALFDEKGTPRAALNVDKDGPGLSLGDERGKHRAALTVVKDGVLLSLRDEDGQDCVMMAVVKETGPAIHLRDESRVIWRAP